MMGFWKSLRDPEPERTVIHLRPTPVTRVAVPVRNPGPVLKIADLEHHVGPSCKCGRIAKYVALVHLVDRCNRIDTFSLTPDGAQVQLVCDSCVKDLAQRLGESLALRNHPAGGRKTCCDSCGRSMRRLHDWLEVSGL